MKGDVGNIFENTVKSAFTQVELAMPCCFKKITDTKQAGNLIKSVPADFELRVPASGKTSYTFLIEAKASDVHETIRGSFRSFVKSHIPVLVRKEIRGGSLAFVMFYSTLTGDIEIWDYAKILEVYSQKRVPIPGEPLMVVSHSNIREFARLVVKDAENFSKKFSELKIEKFDRRV